MSYMTAQGLLKTLIATVTSFESGDVVEGDLRVLDHGATYACVIFPGALPGYDLASMTRVQEYEAMVDLFVRYVDTGAYSLLGTLRDAVITVLEVAPCLSETYYVTAIRGDEPVELYDTTGAGPFFVSQRLHMTIQEQV